MYKGDHVRNGRGSGIETNEVFRIQRSLGGFIPSPQDQLPQQLRLAPVRGSALESRKLDVLSVAADRCGLLCTAEGPKAGGQGRGFRLSNLVTLQMQAGAGAIPSHLARKELRSGMLTIR